MRHFKFKTTPVTASIQVFGIRKCTIQTVYVTDI